jgi:hypothetical protein
VNNTLRTRQRMFALALPFTTGALHRRRGHQSKGDRPDRLEQHLRGQNLGGVNPISPPLAGTTARYQGPRAIPDGYRPSRPPPGSDVAGNSAHHPGALEKYHVPPTSRPAGLRKSSPHCPLRAAARICRVAVPSPCSWSSAVYRPAKVRTNASMDPETSRPSPADQSASVAMA